VQWVYFVKILQMREKHSTPIFSTQGYSRRKTLEVTVGDIGFGSLNPVRVQTMTTTNTNCIDKTIEQIKRTIAAGAQMVRLTTQGLKEVENFSQIKQQLRNQGFTTPLVADIHFNPRVALAASVYADKIRINPGNFSDKSRASSQVFSAEEYETDLKYAEERFVELLNICKKHSTSMRIGVNHGSLSKRIMDRFGDTPLGMAESAMEFLRICIKHSYNKVVVSMKSSNTRVMVQATRLLVSMMEAEEMNFPLHLGVTEAGEGEDGRIKSALGIGALLIDGIGDTIRVSLTEEPENEIPVARQLATLFEGWSIGQSFVPPTINIDPFSFNPRQTKALYGVGEENPPVVMAKIQSISVELLKEWGWHFDREKQKWSSSDNAADYIVTECNDMASIPCSEQLPLVGNQPNYQYSISHIADKPSVCPNFLIIDAETFTGDLALQVANYPKAAIILRGEHQSSVYAVRNVLFHLHAIGVVNPCVVSIYIDAKTSSEFQLIASAIHGSLFIDGLANGILLRTSHAIRAQNVCDISFGILQAARVRMTKTEFISCPGCGRTLFNLNATLLKVKERTTHLKGLKIGVMGCIVNGPGEMADADYGYVGSGPGKVTLYRKQEIVKKNIAEKDAVDELVAIIKANDDWVDAE
jgi:(E)-4-hydroxy-3-methylbut-2-enyl-diphosphate synthase